MRAIRRTNRRLLVGVVILVGKLGQHVRRVTVTGIGKATQLGSVATLARQLDKLIYSVAAAGVRETTQLLHVTSLARQLNQLVDGISIPVRGPHPQVRQLRFSHAAHPSPHSAPA
jgi:hypothetical protein